MCLRLLGQGAEGPRAGARARGLVVGAVLVVGAALVVWAVLRVQAAMVGEAALAGEAGRGDLVILMVGEGEGAVVTLMERVGDAGTSMAGEGGC